MEIHVILFLILFNVIKFEITPNDSYDINYYIDLMKNEGNYNNFLKEKIYFGDDVAIYSCSLIYPNNICEVVIRVYMPNEDSFPTSYDFSSNKEYMPIPEHRLPEDNFSLLKSILFTNGNLKNTNILRKNTNKIKKKFPEIFGR